MAVLSNIVVYTGGYLFLVFIAVCLATGLYYLAEMVEEYTRLTKKVLWWAIRISIALDVALLVVDRLPILCVGTAIAAQLTYNTLLKRFPFMEMTSLEFLGSLGMLVANHFVWMRHFREAYHSMEYLLGFFLMVVWIVPFGFFISLAANESVLPSGGLAGTGGGLGGASASGGGGGGGGGMGMGGMPAGAFGTFGDNNGGKKKRANVVLQVLDFGKAQWEWVAKKTFPNGLPGTYKERNL